MAILGAWGGQTTPEWNLCAPPWRSLCVTNSAAPSQTLGTCIMGRREIHPPPLETIPLWVPLRSTHEILLLHQSIKLLVKLGHFKSTSVSEFAAPPPPGAEWSPLR